MQPINDNNDEINVNGIIPAFIPKKVILKTKQGPGMPSKPIVKEGDVVKEGGLIASCDNSYFSCNLHSPIPGKITSIRNIDGKGNYEIEIKYSGTIESFSKSSEDLNNFSNKEIMEKIKWAGITEVLDSNFPLYYLLKLAKTMKIQNLFISNLKGSKAINFYIENKIKEIEYGIKILEKLLEIKRIVFTGFGSGIGLKSKIKNDKIAFKLSKNQEHINYKSNFNSDSPYIYSIRKNNLTLSVDAIILLYEAVLLEKPFTEKIVTIKNEVSNEVFNYKVKLGVNLSEIMEEIKINIDEYDFFVNYRYFQKKIDIRSFTVEKETNIITLKKKHTEKIYANKECTGCNKCIDNCPSEINPREIYNAIRNGELKLLQKMNISYCIKCEICNRVCPANIDILGKIKEVY